MRSMEHRRRDWKDLYSIITLRIMRCKNSICKNRSNVKGRELESRNRRRNRNNKQPLFGLQTTSHTHANFCYFCCKRLSLRLLTFWVLIRTQNRRRDTTFCLLEEEGHLSYYFAYYKEVNGNIHTRTVIL